MEKKEKLTEQLKSIENNIDDIRSDMNSISSKLNSAYSYEDELLQRLEFARKKTKDLRIEFFQKTALLTELYSEVKNICDVFTGNFYNY